VQEVRSPAAAQDGHRHLSEQEREGDWSKAEEETPARGDEEANTAYREGDSGTGDGEGWEAAAEREGGGSYDRGDDTMDVEEQQEHREEEEVEHGFAAVDDETAEPSWS
jgi:hypothetical protein